MQNFATTANLEDFMSVIDGASNADKLMKKQNFLKSKWRWFSILLQLDKCGFMKSNAKLVMPDHESK